MSTVYERVVTLLQNEFGLYDLTPETPIFSGELLDSMDVLRLITALQQGFSISISAFDVSLETFDTLTSITDLVERKL